MVSSIIFKKQEAPVHLAIHKQLSYSIQKELPLTAKKLLHHLSSIQEAASPVSHPSAIIYSKKPVSQPSIYSKKPVSQPSTYSKKPAS
ncbi:hypothetical protein NPIL_262161, partial [Nephila pilipes]